jgi:hypothetical protein
MRYYWKVTHGPRGYKTTEGESIPGLYAEPLGHEDPRAENGIATDLIAEYAHVPAVDYWVSYPDPLICRAHHDYAKERRVYNYDPIKRRGKR